MAMAFLPLMPIVLDLKPENWQTVVDEVLLDCVIFIVLRDNIDAPEWFL